MLISIKWAKSAEITFFMQIYHNFPTFLTLESVNGPMAFSQGDAKWTLWNPAAKHRPCGFWNLTRVFGRIESCSATVPWRLQVILIFLNFFKIVQIRYSTLKEWFCILFLLHSDSHSHSHSDLCNVYSVALDRTRR